jgi:DNA-binding NtrC family response regulator
MKQQANIWLLDDDESLTDIVQRAFKLEQLTCQVKGFVNSKDLLDKLEQETTPPHLLLVDYYLAGENGLTLIEQLQQHPAAQTVRIILISEALKPEIVAKAHSLNVYQVTAKPFTFQEWRDLADELCLAGYFS